MTFLLGMLVFLFVGFAVRGGAILRAVGLFAIVFSGYLLLTPNHPFWVWFYGLLFGLFCWLLGHWAYAFAYGEYKSSLAGWLLEEVILPRLHLRGALSSMQRTAAQLGRALASPITSRISAQTGLAQAAPTPQPPSAEAVGGRQAAEARKSKPIRTAEPLSPVDVAPAIALTPEQVRAGVLQAGEAAAATLRPRLLAELRKADGEQWLEQLNRHRTRRRAYAISGLEDPRAVLSTLAHYPRLAHHPQRREARKLLEMMNGAHHHESMRDFEIVRAWDLAVGLGAKRPSC